MIGRLIGSWQLDVTSRMDKKFFARYICVKHPSSERYLAITAKYNDKRNLMGISNNYCKKVEDIEKSIARLGFQVNRKINLGAVWSDTNWHSDAKQYQQELQVYYTTQYRQAMIPISRTNVICIRTADYNFAQYITIEENIVEPISFKMPNSVALDILKRTLTEENKRLYRYKEAQWLGTPSLDEAIEYLDSQRTEDSKPHPKRMMLVGDAMAMYHLALITVLGHMERRLETRSTTTREQTD